LTENLKVDSYDSLIQTLIAAFQDAGYLSQQGKDIQLRAGCDLDLMLSLWKTAMSSLFGFLGKMQ
jgi:hypothetical protein